MSRMYLYVTGLVCNFYQLYLNIDSASNPEFVYRRIAKISRSYSKMSMLMIRVVFETLLNSIVCFLQFLVGLYSKQAYTKGRLIVGIIRYIR